MSQDLVFALTAGTLASLNPCGFAMLPAYLTLFVTGHPTDGGPPDRMAALGRAAVATAAMTGGFVAVFAVFGLLLTPVASGVQRWLPATTIVIGAGLILLGAIMLTGRDVVLRTPKLRGANPVTSPRSMALYGVSYAIAALAALAMSITMLNRRRRRTSPIRRPPAVDLGADRREPAKDQ